MRGWSPLPARRVPFDHHDVQAFRRRIHGGHRVPPAPHRRSRDRRPRPIDLGFNPRQSATLLDRGIGSTRVPRQINHGDVAALTWNWSSIAWLSASVSRSTNL